MYSPVVLTYLYTYMLQINININAKAEVQSCEWYTDCLFINQVQQSLNDI